MQMLSARQITTLHLDKQWNPRGLQKQVSFMSTGRKQRDIGGPHLLVKCPDHWLRNKTNHQAAREHFPWLQMGWALGPWEAALLLTFEIIVKWKTHIPEPSCQEQYKTESAKIIKAEPKNTGKAGDCELAFQRALELDPPSEVGERSLLIIDV